MSASIERARALLAEHLNPTSAWFVGGTLRDELLARPTTDIDIVIVGDPRRSARRLAAALKVPSFALSGQFSTWRVVGDGWQIDISALQGDGTLAADLARRDLTINAIARPVGGDELIDPHGGIPDLARRRLRMIAPAAFDDDPLRMLRVARFVSTLGFSLEQATVAAIRARAGAIASSAGERIFAELRELIVGDDPLAGLRALAQLNLTEHVLPELSALRGVEQNRYHHLDVYDHTLLVLEHTLALERDPGAVIGGLGETDEAAIAATLTEPLADGLKRAGALRFGALLHDVSKPETQARADDGTVTGFPGHAQLGADRLRATMRRLRTSERLGSHLAALTLHHLALGFLVHEPLLDRTAIYRYLRRTEPVQVDVSLLSVADRLATGGHKAELAIERHLRVARQVLPAALAWSAEQSRRPLLRGSELTRRLGIEPGPLVGDLLERIAEARYVGEITDSEGAIAVTREFLAEQRDN